MSDTTDTQRRKLLKGAISASTVALVTASGLLMPKQLLAHWPQSAFNAKTVEEAILGLLGEPYSLNDEKVYFKVGAPPSYAVNGAAVPVEVSAELENIEKLMILVDKNPFPLAMSVELTPEVMLPFKSMIKVAEDSTVIAIVQAEGKLYRTERAISVDIGGCA
jgi:sulfur-oxidizing protein SoxY